MNIHSHYFPSIEMQTLSPLDPSQLPVVDIAETVSPLVKPAKIAQAIQESKEIDWKSVAIRVLSFLAGAALGTLTGLAIGGIMVTPVGWALTGAALLIILIGSAHYGGLKEFLKALCSAAAGFGIGMSAMSIGPMVAVETLRQTGPATISTLGTAAAAKFYTGLTLFGLSPFVGLAIL